MSWPVKGNQYHVLKWVERWLHELEGVEQWRHELRVDMIGEFVWNLVSRGDLEIVELRELWVEILRDVVGIVLGVMAMFTIGDWLSVMGTEEVWRQIWIWCWYIFRFNEVWCFFDIWSTCGLICNFCYDEPLAAGKSIGDEISQYDSALFENFL